jgi:filamentous hemagglutinin
VIANPAGIVVSGGGFLNASGVTLTTGTPVMKQGNLDSYRVQGGTISIDGQGLDTRTADYTAILARATQANAGIWAQQLQVVTGANEVQASSVGVGATPITAPLPGTGELPSYALDVAQVGGMYAGKITLIGTEAGLGVRNAGLIQASTGPLTLTQEGWLSNSGTVQSNGAELNIQTRGLIEQNGTVHGNSNVRISSQDRQTYTGITAAQASMQIQAQGDIEGRSGSLFAAGLQQDGTLVAQQTLSLQAQGANRHIQLSGQAVASGHMNLLAAEINLDQSLLKARSATLQATEQNLNLSRAQLDVVQSLNLSTPKQLVTDQAQIRADQLTVQATAWLNRAGQVQQGGTHALSIDLQGGGLDNSAGQLVVNASDLALNVGALNNTDGVIGHAGQGRLNATMTSLENSRGQITGNGNIKLDSTGNITSSNGLISATGDLDIHSADLVSTQSGARLQFAGIQSQQGSVTLHAKALNNSASIYAAKNLDINATGLDNSGSVYAAGQQNLTTKTTLTNSGTLAAGQDLTVKAQSVSGTASNVLAAGMAADGKLTGVGHSIPASGRRKPGLK